MLLLADAKRRDQDGLPPNSSVISFGFKFAVQDGAVRLTSLDANSPASSSKLVSGDVIAKVNGVELTKETIPNFGKMIEGNLGTKLRLTVRHPGGTQEDVDLEATSWRRRAGIPGRGAAASARPLRSCSP